MASLTDDGEGGRVRRALQRARPRGVRSATRPATRWRTARSSSTRRRATGPTSTRRRNTADFQFRFEFQLTPGANSGVGIRTPNQGDAAYVGMEIQVLDDTAPVYATLQPYQYHGSVVRHHPGQAWLAEAGRRVELRGDLDPGLADQRSRSTAWSSWTATWPRRPRTARWITRTHPGAAADVRVHRLAEPRLGGAVPQHPDQGTDGEVGRGNGTVSRQ